MHGYVVLLVTTNKLAEERSAEAVRVRCLRLSRLSGKGMLSRLITFWPSERVIFGMEVSSSRFLLSGTKYPICEKQNDILVQVKTKDTTYIAADAEL